MSEIDITAASIKALGEAIGTVYGKTDSLRSAQDKYTLALKTLASASKATAIEIAKYNKEIVDSKKNLEDAYKAHRDTQKVLKDLEKSYDNTTKGVKKYFDGIQASIGGLRQMGSAVTKYTAVLGASALSTQNVIKSTLDYHQSMFQLSRTQQVAGRTTGDFDKALAKVKSSTVLSSNQFLSMADSVSRVFVGIKPTASAMADMSAMLQSQFGPNVDTIKQKFEELAGIQQQFPSLYDDIEKGMQLVGKSKAGDKGAKDELERLKQRLYLTMMNSNMTKQQKDTMLQSLTATTSAQDKENELQKARADLTKSSENAMLALGQSTEGVMIAAAKGASELYGWIEKMPGAVGSAAVAFAALDVAMNLSSGISAIKVAISSMPKLASAAGRVATPFSKIGSAIKVGINDLPKMGVAMGGLASGVSIVGAGILGWEIGTKIDEVTGLSDKIAKLSGYVGNLFGISADKSFMGNTGEAEIAKFTKQYGDAFTKKFKEMGGEQAKGIKRYDIAKKSIKGMREEMNALQDASTKPPEEAVKLWQEYEKTLANQNAMLGIVNQITDSMKGQVTIAESFGRVSTSALQGVIKGTEMAAKVARSAASTLADTIMSSLPEFDIKINVPSNISGISKLRAIQGELLKLMDDGNTSAEKRKTIEQQLVQIINQVKKADQADKDVIDAKYEASEASMKQMEQYSTAYEGRLNAERKLMESAQFGMGASVEMMQKQVDLAYQFMKEYAETDKAAAQRLIKDETITEEQLKHIQNAKTQKEAQEYIEGTLKKEGNARDDLLKYAYKHQQYTTKTMEQQQKIYDLTKDIREGYLDAVRAMAVGAGEFEKIIGTQEMGTSQLMETVEGVTGATKLNTFALGGRQSRDLTQQGVGTGLTGEYSESGIKFIGGDVQESRNKRINEYASSKDKAEAVMRGEVSTGAQSKVGGMNVAGAENYIAPEREAEIQGKIIGKEVADALTDPGYLNAVNKGVKEQKFNKGEVSRIKATAASSGALGHEFLDRAKAPAPATGGYVNTAGGNRLPAPGLANNTLKDDHLAIIAKNTGKTTEEVIKASKKSTVDLKKLTTKMSDLSSKPLLGGSAFFQASRGISSAYKSAKTMEEVQARSKQRIAGEGGLIKLTKGASDIMDNAVAKNKKDKEREVERKEEAITNRKIAAAKKNAEAAAANYESKKAELEKAKTTAGAQEAIADAWEKKKAAMDKAEPRTHAGNILEKREINKQAAIARQKANDEQDKFRRAARSAADAGEASRKAQSEYTNVSDVAQANKAAAAAKAVAPAQAAIKEPKAAAQATAKGAGAKGAADMLGTSESGEVVVKIVLAPYLIEEILKNSGARIQIEHAAS